jgi:hypothetical protein
MSRNRLGELDTSVCSSTGAADQVNRTGLEFTLEATVYFSFGLMKMVLLIDKTGFGPFLGHEGPN